MKARILIVCPVHPSQKVDFVLRCGKYDNNSKKIGWKVARSSSIYEVLRKLKTSYPAVEVLIAMLPAKTAIDTRMAAKITIRGVWEDLGKRLRLNFSKRSVNGNSAMTVSHTRENLFVITIREGVTTDMIEHWLRTFVILHSEWLQHWHIGWGQTPWRIKRRYIMTQSLASCGGKISGAPCGVPTVLKVRMRSVFLGNKMNNCV